MLPKPKTEAMARPLIPRNSLRLTSFCISELSCCFISDYLFIFIVSSTSVMQVCVCVKPISEACVRQMRRSPAWGSDTLETLVEGYFGVVYGVLIEAVALRDSKVR